MTPLGELRNQLIKNIKRWKGEIEQKEKKGTALDGVVNKSAQHFEKILKRTAKIYMEFCSIDYAQLVAGKVDKPFEKLTLGQFFNCLQLMDESISEFLRGHSKELGDRLIKSNIVKPSFKKLDQVIKLRNILTHAKDELDAADEAKHSEQVYEMISSMSRFVG